MKIQYIYHTTSFKNLQSIAKEGFLYTTYERYLMDISASGLNTYDKKEKGYDLYEFPGIFLSWYTKCAGQFLASGNITLVFGADLLKMQKNYHLNLLDHNGYFTESITYFPEDLDKIPIENAYKFWSDYQKKHGKYISYRYNEVVFHDKINIDLVKYIWFKNKESLIEAKKLLPQSIASKCRIQPKNIDIVVKTSKKELNKVNTMSEAIRVFSSDERYDGVKTPLYLPKNKRVRYKSSLSYVKNIARTAGVSNDVLQTLHTSKEVEKYLEKYGYYDKAITRATTL